VTVENLEEALNFEAIHAPTNAASNLFVQSRPMELHMRQITLLLVFLMTTACATTQTADKPASGHFELGDRMIVEVTSGEVRATTEVVRDLRTVRHLYVGERHAVPGYQETQLEVVRSLHQSGARIGIGIEWLPMESQKLINAYITGSITEDEFIRRVNWKHLWGHNFEAYRPIFRFARSNRIPIWALDAPHGLARAVGRFGITKLPPKWRPLLPALNTKNRAHREFFEAMMSAVAHAHRGHKHGHGHGHHRHKKPSAKGETMMDKYYTAQVLRDEYMAKNLVRHLARPENKERIAVVFAGIGHTDFALGIPLRAARLLSAPFRIVLPVPNGKIDANTNLLRNKPYPLRRADYLWEAPSHRPHLVYKERPYSHLH
jgi:uncharacterized iron-regulated protein